VQLQLRLKFHTFTDSQPGVPIYRKKFYRRCKSFVHSQQGKIEKRFQSLVRKIYGRLDRRQQKVKEAMNYEPFKIKE
jgi:hypothetical protein